MTLKGIADPSKAPPYAILSHTWSKPDEDPELLFEYLTPEVSRNLLEDMSAPGSRRDKAHQKIVGFCKIALDLDFEYGWLDTLCIDKRVRTKSRCLIIVLIAVVFSRTIRSYQLNVGVLS